MTQIDLAALVAWEGRWAKTIYREFALRNKISFSREFDGKDAMYALAKALRKDNFNVFKRMIKICLHIGGQHNMSWEDL